MGFCLSSDHVVLHSYLIHGAKTCHIILLIECVKEYVWEIVKNYASVTKKLIESNT